MSYWESPLWSLVSSRDGDQRPSVLVCRLCFAVAILPILVGACSGVGSPTPEADPTLSSNPIEQSPVTQPTDSASKTQANDLVPAGCKEDSVRSTVEDFIATLSGGKVEGSDLVDRYIAPSGAFGWFGTPDRPFPGPGSDYATLAAYFTRFTEAGYEWRLLNFDYNGWDAVTGAHFEVEIEGTFGGDVTVIQSAKGGIDCDSGKIAVWLILTSPG